MANEASGCEVDLAEFDRLREEIDNRTELSVNLVLAEIAALGAGISVVDKVPDVLLGLAAVSGFLWLLWMDHTEAIHKIALYIAHELAPRIQISYAGGLGWEKFLRGLDSTDKLTRKGRRKRNIVLYIRLLFCGTPLVFLIAYPVVELYRKQIWFPWANLSHDLVNTLRFAALVLTTALWGYALDQHFAFQKSLDKLDRAIRVQEVRPPTPSDTLKPGVPL